MAGAPGSCRNIQFHEITRELSQYSQPVEARTEGETAEELICLISKSAHAGTVEKVLSPGNCQKTDDN